jgi:hypothetical protein
MRGLYLGLTLAVALLSARPLAGAEALASCTPARTNLDKLICRHPDLLESSNQITERVELLRRHYQGENRRVFNVEYKRWRYELSYCALLRRDPGNKKAYGCVRGNFDARLQLLADLASGSKEIQEVAASYYQVQPWYVNELPKQYEGRAVYVDGYIYLKGCYRPGMPHSGLIGFPKWALQGDIRPVPYTAKNVSIEIRFDRISEDAMGRICDKRQADLTGTVMFDQGKPYIYVPELW